MNSRKMPIGLRFSRKAHSYDKYAVVQRRMADTLLRLLKEQQTGASTQPLRILEIGCGTGQLTAALLHTFPEAHVTAVDLAPGMLELAADRLAAQADRVAFIQADIEQWADEQTVEAFDLIISNACFQWLAEPGRTFRRLRRLTAPGGSLMFSTFGPATFSELHHSFHLAYEAIGRPSQRHGLPMREAESWPPLTAAAGWNDPMTRQETVVEWFPSVREFLHSIQSIGASATQADQETGLASRRRLFAEMTACYEREYASPSGIPATYELVFLSARS